MSHDPSPVYLFDRWLMNDTVCAILLYWTRTNRSCEINQKSNKTKQKDDKKKSVFFSFFSFSTLNKILVAQHGALLAEEAFFFFGRAICIPAVRVRTIKPFPLQSISLQPAIQATL